MSTASRNLLAGQERYKRDFDNRIRYPTPDYRVGDQVLVNRKAVLRSDEKTDKDLVNNKLAPQTEGPFLVVQVDDHTVTILSGTGLKDRLSRDRVVKAPPLRSNVEEPPLRRVETNGEDRTPPSTTLSRGSPPRRRSLRRTHRVCWTPLQAERGGTPSRDWRDSALRSEESAPSPGGGPTTANSGPAAGRILGPASGHAFATQPGTPCGSRGNGAPS